MSGPPSLPAYVDIAVKSAMGAAVIALLLSLARLRQYVITGLIVSIPAVSLYTWWWVGREHGADMLRISVRAAMWSSIPWVLYLGTVYALAGRVPLWVALLSGVLVWLAIAAVFAYVLQGRG
ncbi:MAG: GlpM family protein [Armatimonadetes bacterium]|nr:GlpM family protein [Armatimonadota bacterium]